jgi:transposase
VASAFLKDYKGVVQTDGYAGYGFIDGINEILHMGCWAHVRRKFLDVVKAAGKLKDGRKKSGNADQALKYIRKLYKIEKDAKNSGLTDDDLLTRLSHFKKNMPIFNGLWLQSLQTSFKFCLGQVFLYW